MGTSPETRKRRASYEPSWDVRPVKSKRTSRHGVDCASHAPYMVTITKALPCSVGGAKAIGNGSGLNIIESQVVGSFSDPLRAELVLLDRLNVACEGYDQAVTEADVPRPCINEIHRSYDSHSGQLCIVQQGTDYSDSPGYLRIGEVIPGNATKLQQQITQNSVYVVNVKSGEGYQYGTIGPSTETSAIYRSAHEANQYVIQEFSRHGGLQRRGHRSTRSDQETCIDANESDVYEKPALSFVNGFAQARIGSGADALHWEVLQKIML